MRRLISNTLVPAKALTLAIATSFLAVCPPVLGQTPTHLDQYVQTGLRQNLGLQQQILTARQAGEATNEARGLLLPSLSIDTRYSDVSGSSLDFGDLINPVYSTLNQVTGQDRFPTDLSLKLPYKQETKIRLTQPIFQPKAIFNFRVRRDLQRAEQARLAASARDLAAQIKTTYLDYAKSVRVVELYTQTLALLEENLRVSRKLVDNQKATLDVVYRAKAELSDIQQKRDETERQRDDVARYFNFLINQPPDQAIELDSDSVIASVTLPSVYQVLKTGLNQRDELRQVDNGFKASVNNVKLNSSAYLPAVSLVADYGFQGQDYRFSSSNDVTTVSLVAQ